jgi:predicted permease
MEMLAQDIRYAWRKITRAPGFALVVVLTVALGVGGTTAVFSFVNAVMLRPLPVDDPDQLIWLGTARSSGPRGMSFAYPEYRELRDSPAPISGLAAFGMQPLRVEAGDQTVSTVGALASDNYFQVLGVPLAKGRFGGATDAGTEAPGVVLSDPFWKRVFNADPSVVGRAVRINGQAAVVLGVAPAGFGGTISVVGLDVWIPLSAYPHFHPGKRLDEPGHAFLQLVGRLNDGASSAAAATALSAAARRAKVGAAYGQAAQRVTVEPLGGINGPGRGGAIRLSTLLFATAFLVLGIACVNVVGMLAARNALRSSEIGVRAALGASPRRIATQLATETLTLWSVGGAAGLYLAVWLGRVFLAAVPVQDAFPARLGLDMELDGTVLFFAIALTLVSGLASGLLPAIHASRSNLVGALKEQFDGQRRSSTRNALTTIQVACSLLLLINAGLLLRSAREISTADPGFDPDRVSSVPLDLSTLGKTPREVQTRVQTFFPELLRRLNERSDLETASLATALPLAGANHTTRITVPDPGFTSLAPIESEIPYTAVSPGYFHTMRIPVKRGRGITEEDRFGSTPVAIVSEGMARQYWPGKDPLGRTIQQGPVRLRVVGVAGDIRDRDFNRAQTPLLYVAFAQEPMASAHLLVRAERPLGKSLVDEIHRVDPDVRAELAVPLRDMIVAAMPQRFLAPLLGAFGVLGLLLSTLGIYGLVAYFTAHRTREFCIRMALGADRGHILRVVLARGLSLALAGTVFGVPVALAIAQAIRPLLAGTSTLDPLTYAVVILLLLATSVCASLLPALRAVRLQPMSALRSE